MSTKMHVSYKTIRKVFVLALYVFHIVFMLGGALFAIFYFLLGKEFLLDGLDASDQKMILSFSWWQVIVGAIYPMIMFIGVHLLYKRKHYAAITYFIGCLIYAVTNMASYLYALITNVESAARLEDLLFPIFFIVIACLVKFISKQNIINAKAE